MNTWREKNIVVEWRSAEGRLDRLPGLAAELVRLRVNAIVTAGPIPTRSAKEATTTIPIVMTQDTDPVGNGFVASLARPGGNITGLATLRPELSGRQLELLKEIFPKLSRVAVFGTSSFPGNTQSLKETELAAGASGVKLQYLDVLDPRDIDTSFRATSKGRAEAILMMITGGIAGSQRKQIADLAVRSQLPAIYRSRVNAIMTTATRPLFAERKRIVELAVKYRLPAIYSQKEYVDEGGLMSYGADFDDLFRRAAVYVDKILKGAKPADLHVQQATKFEFIINLKAAKQIGLTIPVNVLERANKVI